MRQYSRQVAGCGDPRLGVATPGGGVATPGGGMAALPANGRLWWTR